LKQLGVPIMARTNLAAHIVARYGGFVKLPKMASHKLPKMAKFGFINFCQVWSPNIPHLFIRE